MTLGDMPGTIIIGRALNAFLKEYNLLHWGPVGAPIVEMLGPANELMAVFRQRRRNR